MDSHLLAKLGTLRQFEIFLKVAEVGGIAQAAEQLYLTQPSVSIQVKNLAEAIGIPLYEVVGRRLSLTDAGLEVEKAAREIVDTLNRLNSTINDLKGLQSGTLRIAVDSSAKYFLPYLLGPFCRRYPGIDVSFKEGNRQNLLERLSNNQDDFYVFNHIPKEMDICNFEFLPNPLVVIASEDHPLAGASQLQWQDIAQERFIIRELGSGSRYAIDEFLRRNKWQMGRVMTLESSEAIKLSVMQNMGVSIMSAYALVNADSDRIVQLRVEGFPIMTQWHVIHLRQKHLSVVAQSFLDFVLDEAEQHLPMERIEQRVQQAKKY